MLLITYDISNTKLRTRFSKFIKKYGYRVQYSVYQVENSQRILELITIKINRMFVPRFQETDSVLIYNLSKNCKRFCFGYARHEEEDLIII